MRRKSTEEDTSQLDKSEDECGDSGTRDSNDDSMYVCVCVCVCVCVHVRVDSVNQPGLTLCKRSLPRVPGDFQMTFIKVETLCLVPSTFHFAINTILFVFFHSFNIC